MPRAKRTRIYPLLDDVEWLRRRYVDEGASTEEIAQEIGCTHSRVYTVLKQVGIPVRIRPRTYQGEWQTPIAQLRDAAWLRTEYLERGRSVANIAHEIGCTTASVQKALWRLRIRRKEPLPAGQTPTDRTARYQKKGGYRLLYMPEHPVSNGQGYVLEHRLVVEKELGRYLEPREVVHHINEKQGDNRPENLMVFPTNAAHMSYHANPPTWIPRCECCNHALPERVAGRPEGVPMVWEGGV